MIRPCALAPVACIALFASIKAVSADPLPTETFKILPAALAVEAAQAAVAACKAQGYIVSVAIVDRAGTPKLLLVGDGASALSRRLSRRKAYTAAVRRVSTGELAKQSRRRARSIRRSTTHSSSLPRAAYRSRRGTRPLVPLESVVRREATRTKAVPTLASPKSAIG
jgi:hypothetical protein